MAISPCNSGKLKSLLRHFDNTGEDSKLARFITILGQELASRESAIAFTQYPDTMDSLRETVRDRIDTFSSVVGNLQPILAQVPTFIEQATMSVDSEEEDVLLSEFEAVLDAPPIRPALEDMVKMDVEADLKEIRKPLPAAPVTAAEIQELFTRSHLLKARGVEFSEVEAGIWALKYKGIAYQITFDPILFEEKPSLRLMTWGEPLFDRLIGYV